MFSMIVKYARVTLVLAALGPLGACATLTTGTDQTLTVTTEPAGAQCALRRNAQMVGVVNPTPGSVSVSRSSKAIDVTCQRKGYLKTEDVVGVGFKAMTLGNVLFGGIFGIAVDAASGAMNKYPNVVHVQLTPTVFATAEERDQLYDRLVSNTEKEGEEVAEKLRNECREDQDCEKDIKEARLAVESRLEKLERERSEAVIDADAAQALKAEISL